MATSPARQAAFQILLRVERESAYAVELLHSQLLDGLSPEDRNLTTDIVMGVLRWQSRLDERFVSLLKAPLRKLDLEVLIALRMGAYQLAFLSRTPGHAIVNETVELVKVARKRSASGLVNAVMRKLERDRRELAAEGKSLAADYAHPDWLVAKWEAQFGHEKAKQVCRHDQQVPATALRIGNAEIERSLIAEGVQLAPGMLMSSARVVLSGDVTRTSAFREGRVAIQDEGSQLVAALVRRGQRILDCCAAPGIKTAAMATAMPEAEIVATEIHPHRARVLRQLAPQANVRVMTADALQLPFGPDFDRVLADVPCSGTGTLGRNPEIKWRLTPEDIKDLQARQIAILNAALKHVAPGGRLVYATCSLEVEEDEQVIEAGLRQNPGFRIVPVRNELIDLQKAGVLVWPAIDALVSGNYLRTFPGTHPCDGFFAGVVERV
jgi:16S rRNA (cytosine967-C5)-methyltransferase